MIEAVRNGLKPQADPRLKALLEWMLEQNANSAHNVLEPLTINGLKTDRKSYPPEQILNLGSLADEGILLLDVKKTEIETLLIDTVAKLARDP